MKFWKFMLCGIVAAFLLLTSKVWSAEVVDNQAIEGKEGKVAAEKKEEGKEVEKKGLSGTVTLSGFSQYIFRGYELSSHSAVIQPYISMSYAGFTASYWGNLDTYERATTNFVPDKPGETSYNESDMTLSYSYAMGKLGLTGGYTYYATKYADDTEEVFLVLAYETFLTPTLSIYRDITSYPGTYFNFSVAHSIPIHKEVTLDLGGSIGYLDGDSKYWNTYQRSTEDYTGSKYSAFHDGMIKAGFTIPIPGKITLQPLIQYWFPLSDKARRRIDGNAYSPNGELRAHVVGGININYGF